jgi:hypothetical protein
MTISPSVPNYWLIFSGWVLLQTTTGSNTSLNNELCTELEAVTIFASSCATISLNIGRPWHPEYR